MFAFVWQDSCTPRTLAPEQTQLPHVPGRVNGLTTVENSAEVKEWGAFFNSYRLIDEAHSRMEFGEEVSGVLKNREGKM